MTIIGQVRNPKLGTRNFKLLFSAFYTRQQPNQKFVITFEKLGWKQQKGSVKKPVRSLAPSITTVIENNKYIAEIFDKYPLHTYYQEVDLPLAV
jgi:hypothetical protein